TESGPWGRLLFERKQRTDSKHLYPHAASAYIRCMHADAELSFADTSIEVKGAAPLAARVYGKRRAGALSPLVVHFHGGAFVSGDLASGECMARLLVEAGAIAVSVAYPLAPQHRFPEAVEAGYVALGWT